MTTRQQMPDQGLPPNDLGQDVAGEEYFYAKYVFLDVVRFSKRDLSVQSTIVNVLNDIVSDCVEDENGIPREGRIFIPTGDGLCIALKDKKVPDAHLRIALGILKRLHEYNETAVEKFEIRVGIHQDEDKIVLDINGNRNVAGAGIITAQRIMGKADGNQILVSATVFDMLKVYPQYQKKRFRKYETEDKHGDELTLYQYTGDGQVWLNKSAPRAFRSDLHLSGLRMLEKGLNGWRKSLTHDVEDDCVRRTLEEAWKGLVELYLKRESGGPDTMTISATSEVYTQLYKQLTDYLYKDLPDAPDAELCRFHVTGMLPEQFFNGPQIAYTTLNSSPIIFCHAFEGDAYKSHREAQKDLGLGRLQIKRCLFVRGSGASEQFSALSDVDALKKQFELVIHPPARKPSTLFELLEDPEANVYLKRLFIHCREAVETYDKDPGNAGKPFLKRIVKGKDYLFDRIAEAADVGENGGKHVNLIEHFKAHYGTDFYYTCVTDTDRDNDRLDEYFKVGGWPEIILFGFSGGGRREAPEGGGGLGAWASSVEWVVGIKSHYAEMSRQMEITLLGPKDVSDFLEASSRLLREAEDL